MKRLIILAAALVLLIAAALSTSGCGRDSVTGISMAAQEYYNGSIYELPRFDGTGGSAEQLNAAIQSDLFYYISGWDAVRNDGTYRYELRSYPICSDRYIQVVVTAIELPNYGTDGDVFSYCYDSQTGDVLTLDDALDHSAVSRETTESRIRNRIGDYLIEGDNVAFMHCTAFAFADDELCIVARALIENEFDAGRDELYVYYVKQDAIQEYDGGDLFPAGLCDRTDPPLSYAMD